MNNKFSAYGLFYILGLAFWLLSMNLSETTLLCVFYSFFVGTVWGMVPGMSGSEPISIRNLLPPFMLVMLMMFSVSLKLVVSTEVILITSISLIHFRASILTFTRLSKKTLIFSWLQLASFVYSLLYLFQKNLLPFNIQRSVFLMSLVVVGLMSIGVLLVAKRNKVAISSSAPQEI